MWKYFRLLVVCNLLKNLNCILDHNIIENINWIVAMFIMQGWCVVLGGVVIRLPIPTRESKTLSFFMSKRSKSICRHLPIGEFQMLNCLSWTVKNCANTVNNLIINNKWAVDINQIIHIIQLNTSQVIDHSIVTNFYTMFIKDIMVFFTTPENAAKAKCIVVRLWS